MKTYKEFMQEAFNSPIVIRYILKNDRYWVGEFEIQGNTYTVNAKKRKNKDATGVEYDVDFTCKDDDTESYCKTGFGKTIALSVFSTVLEFIKSFILETHPVTLTFSADKLEGDSRSSLYKKMVNRFLPKDYTVKIYEDEDKTFFELHMK